MALIVIVVNDCTGTNESANYRWRAQINERVIASGEVKGHNRNDGWQDLIRRVTEDEDARPRSRPEDALRQQNHRLLKVHEQTKAALDSTLAAWESEAAHYVAQNDEVSSLCARILATCRVQIARLREAL